MQKTNREKFKGAIDMYYCKTLFPSSNTEIQTKKTLQGSIGSMKRQTNTRNYNKIQYK